MPMQRRTLLLSIIALSLLFSCVYFLLQNINTLSPLGRIKNAQQVAKLSGEYAFRSEIDQITNLSPNTSNYGKKSRQETFVVEGAVNESQQTSNLTISNTQGVLMEVKRERGVTYMRQAGGAWQRSASSGSASQLNSLSFLAGVSNATRDMSDTQRYTFDFDGAKFSDHFARLLSADAAHGIAHNQEWTDIANSAQYRLAHGDGKIVIDSDGLPQSIEMRIAMPGDKKQGSSDTHIATTFFNYARTGLALQKLAHNPFYMLGNLVGSDVSTVRSLLLGCIAVLLLIVSVSVLFAMRRKLYVPLAILVIGIMLFQPFSSIPRTLAASQTPPVAPGTPSNPTTPPEPVFNPLLSPFNQGAAIALPAAGTSTAPGMVVGRSATQRLVRNVNTTNSNAVDTDKDGLSDSEETQYGSNPLLADSDSDGLSDSQEVSLGTNPLLADEDDDGLNDSAELQVGTDNTMPDTDLDGLSDFEEVTTFTQYTSGGQKFYSDPLNTDTNSDGTNDSMECTEKLFTSTNNCTDTNNDGVPDFLTNDNDGDTVADEIDISPSVSNTAVYSETNPYGFTVANTLTSTRPVYIDMQIRPDNANLLYANDAVYDWPSGDTQGQVQRGRDTTFATSTLFNSKETSASNGDVKVNAILEVRVPVSATNFGNLPIAACNQTNTCPTISDAPKWLDKSKLLAFGIGAGWSRDSQGNILNNEVTLNIPITPDYDGTGTIAAYSAKLYYETGATAWTNSHNVRLMWLVSVITDKCPDDKPDCSVSERVESNTVVQSYYGNWRLIGMNATEDRSAKATIIYEDSTSPANTPNSTRRFEITKIKDVINSAFVQTPYLQIDGTDNNLSLSQLFDSTRNSNATTLSTYGINKSAAKAIAVTVPSQYDVAKVFRNELPNALNNALCRKAGFADNCTQQATLKTACENNMAIECRPAVLVTSETKKRHAQLRANSTVLDFNDTSEYTSRTLNSAIYKMVGGQWQAFDENDTTTEISFIKQNTPAGSTPNWLTTEKWNTFFEGMLIQSMFNFDNPEAKNYETNSIATLNSDINATTFASGNSTSWGQYIGVQAEVFQTLLQSIFPTTSTSSIDLATANTKEIVDNLLGTLFEDPTISQTGKGPYLLGLNVAKTIGKLIGTKLFNYFKLSNVVKMGTAAKYGSLAGMAVGGGLMMLADSKFIKNNDVKITLKLSAVSRTSA